LLEWTEVVQTARFDRFKDQEENEAEDERGAELTGKEKQSLKELVKKA
jgi:hypothetical protein